MGWEDWSAAKCLELNLKKVAKEGVNLPVLLGHLLDDLTSLAANEASVDGKKLQELMIHTVMQYGRAKKEEKLEGGQPNDWTTAAESTYATLTSQVLFMQSNSLGSWSIPAWIDSVGQQKD